MWIVWDSWVGIFVLIAQFRDSEEFVCFVANHCTTNTLTKLLHLFSDVVNEGTAIPAGLEHDGVGLDPFR